MGGKLNPTSILPLIDCDWTVVWRWEMTFNVVYCWSSIVITGWWQRFSVNAFPGATVCAVVSHSHVWSVLILCNLMTAVLGSWKKKNLARVRRHTECHSINQQYTKEQNYLSITCYFVLWNVLEQHSFSFKALSVHLCLKCFSAPPVSFEVCSSVTPGTVAACEV